MNVRLITVMKQGLGLEQNMLPMLMGCCSSLPLFEKDAEFELDFTSQTAVLTIAGHTFNIGLFDVELRGVPAVDDPDFAEYFKKVHVVIASNDDDLPSKEQAVPLFGILLQTPVDIENVTEHLPHRSDVFKLNEIQPFSIYVPEMNESEQPLLEFILSRAEKNPSENVSVASVN